MSKMTESELKAILSAEIANSIGHIGGELSEQRRKALDYYLGQPFGNEIEGRSKVVSTGRQATPASGITTPSGSFMETATARMASPMARPPASRSSAPMSRRYITRAGGSRPRAH